MRRSSVVLPAPLGPVISTSSPRDTLKLTSEKTAVRPKDLVTCAMRTAGAGGDAPLEAWGCAPFPLVAWRAAALPLPSGFTAAATPSWASACAPLETIPRCPTLSPSRLAQAGRNETGPGSRFGPARSGPAQRQIDLETISGR